MGIDLVTPIVFFWVSLAFAYAVKRHYDTRLKQVDTDKDMEILRLEHRSAEYKELEKRISEMEKKFNKFRAEMALGR